MWQTIPTWRAGVKLKFNQSIEVEWNDTFSTCNWHTDASASNFPIVLCKSVGYFLNQDKKVLRLSHTIQSGNFTDRDVTAIPQGCITKIRRLK